ncbi:hypothetical protein AB0L47_07690 [Streptomyces bobili]|uniref:hypothetical protein n=1 Tax=Streptomyces bobili TaxID=67280 RepID=UPI00344A2104
MPGLGRQICSSELRADRCPGRVRLKPEGTTGYELVYDGEAVPPDKTVGDIARHGHQLRLRLCTVTISG